MARVESYTCDVCGNRKGETNHWWKLITEDAGSRRANTSVFAIYPWASIDDGKAAKHICSEACAAKALSKWMGENK